MSEVNIITIFFPNIYKSVRDLCNTDYTGICRTVSESGLSTSLFFLALTYCCFFCSVWEWFTKLFLVLEKSVEVGVFLSSVIF